MYFIHVQQDGLFHLQIDDEEIGTRPIFAMAVWFCEEHALANAERKNHP